MMIMIIIIITIIIAIGVHSFTLVKSMCKIVVATILAHMGRDIHGHWILTPMNIKSAINVHAAIAVTATDSQARFIAVRVDRAIWVLIYILLKRFTGKVLSPDLVGYRKR